jgi:sigma-B regulation protein RsbU (phosphoserine phosphatase)
MGSPGASPSPHYVRALVEDDPVELYESAPCGYVSTADDGTITKVNRTFGGWTGFVPDDLVGRRFQTLLAVGDRIFWETHFAPSLALQGTVREIAAEIVCGSGDRLPVLLNAVRSAPEGREPRVRIAVFDARERRAYERELLAERRRAEKAAEDARRLAETLQRTLLPATAPSIEGISVGTAYRSAGDGSIVGGDFYDVFEIHHGTWGVSLGDVCGKGAAAAIITALARHTIRALAVRTAAPSDVLRGLHDAIVRSPDTDGFCTALFLTARAEDGEVHLRLSAGGHHLPLLTCADGPIVEVGRTGHLLGMLEPLALHDEEAVVGPGESLVLYTDGVIEARRGDELYGEDRLRDLIDANRGLDAHALADAIASDAVRFQGEDTRDDIAVLVLQPELVSS